MSKNNHYKKGKVIGFEINEVNVSDDEISKIYRILNSHKSDMSIKIKPAINECIDSTIKCAISENESLRKKLNIILLPSKYDDSMILVLKTMVVDDKLRPVMNTYEFHSVNL